MANIEQRDLFFEIVANLKFISKIKVGEKVDVQSQQLHVNNWITGIYRTFIARRESRDLTFSYFRSVVTNAIEFIRALATSGVENDKKISSIMEALEESKIGFTNLKKTYEDDRMFESKIETLLSTIDVMIRDAFKG